MPRTKANLRVVVGDDSPEVLAQTANLLASVFDVEATARNGKELVQLVLGCNPDVVVADLSMPEMTGIEAARQLMAAGFQGAIVMLSVYNDAEIVKAALDAGAICYVLKESAGEDLV
jgi:DNA-binding NarL/FixJ family response regulator